MPEYQYIFADVLTKEKLGTLPLYGVSFSDYLAVDSTKAGTFTGSIRMDDRQYSAKQILDWTVPGRTQLWIERDRVLKWAGLIWSQTYQSDGRSMQLSGQTFPSYLSTVQWLNDNYVLFNGNDYFGSVERPWNHLRWPWHYIRNEMPGSSVASYYDVGVTLETKHVDPGSPNTRFDFFPRDFKYLQDYVQQMLKGDAEYRIRPFYDPNGTRVALFESHRKGGLGNTESAATNHSVLRYPGVISKYWMTNSASTAAHKVFGIGRAAGNLTITHTSADYTAGYMGMNLIKQYEATTQTTLASAADADLALTKPPIENPVYELAGENVDMSWQLGDRRKVIIDDPYRYPQGPVGGVVRIVGYQLSPESSSGVESLSLVIDDASKLVTLDV